MKTKLLTFLLALTFLISVSTTVNAKQNLGDYEGSIYVRNYDGDTITFLTFIRLLAKKYVSD